MNLMGPPDPNWGESGIDSTGRRRLVCPCCGGMLDWRGRHDCLPSAGGCPPGCSHEAVPAPLEAPLPTEWEWHLAVHPDAQCPRCYDGHRPAECPLAALATLLNLTGICERCRAGTVGPVQWVCPECRERPYYRYVGGVGLVRAATPELLEAAVAVVQAQARDRDARPRREVLPPDQPALPVRIGLEADYTPPAYIERGGYAHRARVIGQVQAMIVVIVGTAATFSHDWANAWSPIALLLILSQLLHWHVWSRRNDDL